MKTQFFKSLLTLGVAAVILVSCGEVPQKEIDDATLAINEVKEIGAATYAPESFNALQDSMKAVMEDIEAEKSNFFKNFDDSKTKLIALISQSADVKQKTEARKEELKAEINQTTVATQELIAANKALLVEAPKGKEGANALLAIEAEIAAIETSLTESAAALEKGDLIGSLDVVKAAKQKATDINTELTDVIAKYQQNKTKKK